MGHPHCTPQARRADCSRALGASAFPLPSSPFVSPPLARPLPPPPRAPPSLAHPPRHALL
ncbi:hypothetical protein K523DRAFT_323175 [Schizophyllum commune Tattone D]|nr:hypothetical protein K523DRAFT_323175 [Schizophyllum commune Tattone D]